MDDDDKERALRRFRGFKCRGLKLDFPAMGPTVQATTPEELEIKTAEALAAAALEDDTN